MRKSVSYKHIKKIIYMNLEDKVTELGYFKIFMIKNLDWNWKRTLR